jgi:hypothetical protein
LNETLRIAASVLALAVAPIAAQAPAAPPASHLGVASCASGVCHGVAKPVDGTDVLRNEYVTWSHFDPHAGAYRTLRSEESRRIAARLGIEAVERDPGCLACHSEDAPAAARGPRFQLDDGVGCEACHGAAGPWIATHDDAPRVTHADNVARGLIALERAAVRARVCAACHVGSADRFANHRLMAAGHARLSFELDTYSELWRTSGGREHYRRDDDYRRRKSESDSVAVWLAGLFDTADRTLGIATGVRHAQGVFPDFALFNCYSCHRAMRLERWMEPPGLAPGSLRINDSALVMLAAALDALDPAAAARLRAATTALHRAANRDLPAMRSAAESLRRQLSPLRQRIAARTVGPAERAALVDAVLAASGRGEYPDYAAAEQAAMAVTLLLAGSGRAPEADPRIEALFADLKDDARYDAARFNRILLLLR